jgi:hypothetical protein
MDPILIQTISKIVTMRHEAQNAVKTTNAVLVIFDLFLSNIEDVNIFDPSVEIFVKGMLDKAIEGQQKSERRHFFGEYVVEFNKLLERIREARGLESTAQDKLKLNLMIEELKQLTPNRTGIEFWDRMKSKVDTEKFAHQKMNRIRRELQRLT